MNRKTWFDLEREADTLVFHLQEITGFERGAVIQALCDTFSEIEHQQPTSVIVDCSNLSYASSVLLEALILLGKRVREHGGRMALCSLTERVREIVEVARLDRLWFAYERLEDAKLALSD